MKLTSTAGSIKTQYGAPNTTPFNASTVTYYVKPNDSVSLGCYAKPNLAYGINNGGAPNGMAGKNFAGPSSQWDARKVFKLQDVDTPSSNFPTTGSNNLFFDLTLAGTTGALVVSSSSTNPIIGNGVTLSLQASPNGSDINVVRVTLKKPGKASNGGSFTPSTFELKSGSLVVYSFTISKWFVAQEGYANGYSSAQTFCKNLGPSANYYRVPNIIDYTNANGYGWTGGLVGQGNNYQRRIGGGVFAEWGRTDDGYYSNSDWGATGFILGYFAIERFDASTQYNVCSSMGAAYCNTSPLLNTGACVTP